MRRLTGAFAPSAVLAIVLSMGGPVLAQVRGAGAQPTPQTLNPASETPAPSGRHDIFTAPEPGPCPLRDSKARFTLKEVEFVGADGFDVSHLKGAYDSQLGQDIPVSAVCDIRDAVAARLFAAGILARVEIPEQRIVGGHLKLEVIEARIVSVHFHGDAGPAQSKVEDYLEHLRGMTPFNLQVAQRYLLLAAGVPGVRISAAIRPSEQGRGAVDLVVTVGRQPIDAAASLQNLNAPSLGRWSLMGRADFNGATTLGDQTSVVLYSSLEGNEEQVVQLVEELRPGDQGLLLHASVSYSTTHPRADLAPLDLNGDAVDAQFFASYPLIRGEHENLSVVGGFEYVDERTNFATGQALIDDRLRILFGRVEGSDRGYLFDRPWIIDGDVELRKGVDILNASPAGEANLSHVGANPDAFVQRLNAHASYRVAPKLELYGGLAAQNTTSALSTFEELVVGNLTYGRGYDPSAVQGDRGVEGTIELRLGPFMPLRNLIVTGYGFFDGAAVKYLDQTQTSTSVRSAGGGLRFSYLNRFDLDIAVADPFDRISVTAVNPPPPRFLMTLTARY